MTPESICSNCREHFIASTMEELIEKEKKHHQSSATGKSIKGNPTAHSGLSSRLCLK